MFTHTLSVLRAGRGRFLSPVIAFCPPCLPDLGFVPNALVQVLPEAGGIFFILCDENIRKYSELLRATEEKKGTLLTVDCYETGARIELKGHYIRNARLDIGDHLIATYEYGLIRIRRTEF